VLAGVSRKISKNVVARLRYGFYSYDEPSTGGFNNHIALLAKCQLQRPLLASTEDAKTAVTR